MAKVRAKWLHRVRWQNVTEQSKNPGITEYVLPAGEIREVPDGLAALLVKEHPAKIELVEDNPAPAVPVGGGTYLNTDMGASPSNTMMTTQPAPDGKCERVTFRGKACGRKLPCPYHGA